MCGRFTVSVDVEEIAKAVEAVVAPELTARVKPTWNAAPTLERWIVQPSPAGRVLVPAVWGVHGGLINIRSETAERKFAAAYRDRRVVVPADGFYEWRGKQPVLFKPRAGGIFVFAGLAEQLPDGREGFAVMTMAADGEIARIHDRMPVILPRDAVAAWLSESRLSPMSGAELVSREVSRLVNDVRNEGPQLLKPPDQLALF
ncbi:MAG TPA: SOS response-associated peptidase [Myxococcales bacterium]|jgi:putative SOS response-associated peptidase YedK|nr:SOS response-associated peptidase [Myxococcales bacterium]